MRGFVGMTVRPRLVPSNLEVEPSGHWPGVHPLGGDARRCTSLAAFRTRLFDLLFRAEEARHPMIERYGDHAANERTFLAWVRTAIAIMAFGSWSRSLTYSSGLRASPTPREPCRRAVRSSATSPACC